jgi:hypothetical protein
VASFCTLILAQSANISVAVIETYPFAKAYNRSPRKFCKVINLI